MKIFKSSNIYLTRNAKVFFLTQSLFISFLFFMIGYTAAFEMDTNQYTFFGIVMMLMSLVNAVITFNALSNGDK